MAKSNIVNSTTCVLCLVTLVLVIVVLVRQGQLRERFILRSETQLSKENAVNYAGEIAQRGNSNNEVLYLNAEQGMRQVASGLTPQQYLELVQATKDSLNNTRREGKPVAVHHSAHTIVDELNQYGQPLTRRTTPATADKVFVGTPIGSFGEGAGPANP